MPISRHNAARLIACHLLFHCQSDSGLRTYASDGDCQRYARARRHTSRTSRSRKWLNRVCRNPERTPKDLSETSTMTRAVSNSSANGPPAAPALTRWSPFRPVPFHLSDSPWRRAPSTGSPARFLYSAARGLAARSALTPGTLASGRLCPPYSFRSYAAG